MAALTTTKTIPTAPSGCTTSSPMAISRPVKLTRAQYATLRQTTFEALRRCISLPESAGGRSHCGSLDGQTILRYGREAAPASRSAPPASAKAQPTNAISGLKCIASSPPASLNSFLANRLKQQLGSAGSTEYSETWREKITPAGLRYWAHTASGRRTSGNASTGWATPCSNQANSTPENFLRRKRESVARTGRSMGIVLSDLNMQVQAYCAEWPSPKANNSTGAGQHGTGGANLQSAVQTVARGALNPAFSLWLQGFPSAWLMCAPLKLKRGRK